MTIVVQTVNTDRDFTWLKSSVADWMHRSDLTGPMNDFIYLAEVRIRTLLRERVSDQASQINTTAGVEYTPLPDDLMTVRSMTIPGLQPTIDYMAPDMFNQFFTGAYSGLPRCYTIIDGQIYLGPTPDAQYTINIMYRFDMPPLTDTAPTNPVLAKWPNIYLFGALTEAADYSRNLTLRDSFNARFIEAINNANLLEFDKNGPMRVRTDGRNF